MPNDLEYEAATWDAWPRCPACGRRRQAVCPACQFAGEEIPLAEYVAPAAESGLAGERLEEEEEDAPVLLMCPGCDEAFAPQFYRVCPQCGHEFDEGIEVGPGEAGQWSGRATALLAAVAAAVVGVLLYLWLLLRR